MPLPVEDHAEHAPLLALELLQSVLYRLPSRLARLEHQHDSVRDGAEDLGARAVAHGRHVEQYQIEVIAPLRQKVLRLRRLLHERQRELHRVQPARNEHRLGERARFAAGARIAVGAAYDVTQPAR